MVFLPSHAPPRNTDLPQSEGLAIVKIKLTTYALLKRPKNPGIMNGLNRGSIDYLLLLQIFSGVV